MATGIHSLVSSVSVKTYSRPRISCYSLVELKLSPNLIFSPISKSIKPAALWLLTVFCAQFRKCCILPLKPYTVENLCFSVCAWLFGSCGEWLFQVAFSLETWLMALKITQGPFQCGSTALERLLQKGLLVFVPLGFVNYSRRKELFRVGWLLFFSTSHLALFCRLLL